MDISKHFSVPTGARDIGSGNNPDVKTDQSKRQAIYLSLFLLSASEFSINSCRFYIWNMIIKNPVIAVEVRITGNAA